MLSATLDDRNPMNLFEYLPPPSPSGGPPGISFIHGDLTKVLCDAPVDALLVSAFKGDYAQTEFSLIGALGRAGVDVGKLAEQKADNLRTAGRCWLSQRLPEQQARELGFTRIICFESERGESMEERMMAIGQALSVVAISHHVVSIAMPLLATGDQGHDVREMLPLLLESLSRQMRTGSRLQRVIIATFKETDVETVKRVVADFRTRPPEAPSPLRHELFISYRHSDREPVMRLVDKIKEVRSGTDIWIDREKLEVGHLWNDAIGNAIDNSKLFVPFYSKAYFESPICREELTAAHIRRRALNKSFIVPVLLDDVELTSFHQVTQYKDWRTQDAEKLAELASFIAGRLTGEIGDWDFRSDGCERCALS